MPACPPPSLCVSGSDQDFRCPCCQPPSSSSSPWPSASRHPPSHALLLLPRLPWVSDHHPADRSFVTPSVQAQSSLTISLPQYLTNLTCLSPPALEPLCGPVLSRAPHWTRLLTCLPSASLILAVCRPRANFRKLRSCHHCHRPSLLLPGPHSTLQSGPFSVPSSPSFPVTRPMSSLWPLHWGPLLLPHAPGTPPTCCQSPLRSIQPGRYDRSEITLMGAHHQPGARRLGDSRPSESTCFHGEQALRNTCTPDGPSTYLSPH